MKTKNSLTEFQVLLGDAYRDSGKVDRYINAKSSDKQNRRMLREQTVSCTMLIEYIMANHETLLKHLKVMEESGSNIPPNYNTDDENMEEDTLS